MTSTSLAGAPRFNQRDTAVAFGELLRRVAASCNLVEQRLAARSSHTPGVAVTRSFFLLEVRRLRSLLFAPPMLFAAGGAQARGVDVADVDEAIAFFENHDAQASQFLEYLFTQNETLAVRAWSVLEATAHEVWVAALNAHPAAAARTFWPESPLPRLVRKITKRERARPRPKPIPEKIGTALERSPFSNPDALAERFAPMSRAFAAELAASHPLRALNAARHIIVHRAARIDQAFVDATGLKYQLGYRLGPRFSDIASWTEAALGWALACIDVTEAWERSVDPNSVRPWPPDFSGNDD